LEFVMLSETFLPFSVSSELLWHRLNRVSVLGAPATAGTAARGAGNLSPGESQILRCLT